MNSEHSHDNFALLAFFADPMLWRGNAQNSAEIPPYTPSAEVSATTPITSHA